MGRRRLTCILTSLLGVLFGASFAFAGASVSVSAPSPAVGTVDVLTSARGGNVVALAIAIDGQALKSCAARSCTATWQTTRVANGSHTVQAFATLRDGSVVSTRREVTVANPVSVMPDLMPSGLSLGSSTATTGAAVSLNVTVGNVGTGSASGVTVAVSFVSGGMTSQAAKVSLGTLASGASQKLTMTLTAPSASGTYSVIATLSTSDPETNTANNTLGTQLVVSDSSTTTSSTPTTTSSTQTAPSKYSASYYVATNGSDSNPGTAAQPFRTLTRGVRALSAGTVLYVRGGTYAESLFNAIPSGTSWDLPVAIAAYPGESVTLKPPVGSYRVLNFEGSGTHHIIIDGLVLDAVNVQYDAVKIGSVTSDLATAAHHIRIINTEIRNAPQNGILAIGGYNEFINLHVHHNSTQPFGHGFYIASSGNLVDGCYVHNNLGYGVQVFNSYGGANNNIVRNTMIYQNGRAGVYQGGLILASGNGHVAYNNIIWGHAYGLGLQIQYGVSNAQAYNNTIFQNASYGIYIANDSANATIRNNIVYRNSPDYVNVGAGTINEKNLIGVDPRFVDAASADFHVMASSSAVAAGMAIPLVNTDIEGNARPNPPTIGAHEFMP